jgi:zinc and cadmium transporter
MHDFGWLALYCVLILVASMFGGYLPLVGKISHGRLQLYLSVSAGVMLGAAFFHVMPDAMEYSGGAFGWWMSLGVVGLFCIERFIAPHSHEMNGGHHHHEHNEHVHEEGHEHKHDHDFKLTDVSERRAAAPAVAGWAAVFGLTLHTFMNGVGLAGAVKANDIWMGVPGIALFFAIVLHKPADALAISTVLSRKHISRQKIFLVLLGFAAMVPIGVIAFYWVGEQLTASARKQLIGAALAFSAGTFLFVALSDLLPEVQFHRHDRVPLFLCLFGGVAFMGFIAYLEPHEHDSKATIVNIDGKAGTVTLKIKGDNGKESEKTFTSGEETEYVVGLEDFRPGEEVVLTEQGGKLKRLKKEHDEEKKGN